MKIMNLLLIIVLVLMVSACENKVVVDKNVKSVDKNTNSEVNIIQPNETEQTISIIEISNNKTPSESILYDNREVIVDSGFSEYFKKQLYVEATITLREEQDITEFIDSLNISAEDLEIEFVGYSNQSFDARITKGALELMRNNSDILSIYLPITIEVEE